MDETKIWAELNYFQKFVVISLIILLALCTVTYILLTILLYNLGIFTL